MTERRKDAVSLYTSAMAAERVNPSEDRQHPDGAGRGGAGLRREDGTRLSLGVHMTAIKTS